MSFRRGKVQVVSTGDELYYSQPPTQPSSTSSLNIPNVSTSTPTTFGSSSGKKRTHGPTRNLSLLQMKPGKKLQTLFNTSGQLVDKDKGRRLANYMGTLVRCPTNVPLQFKNWHKVTSDVKEKLWALILEKYHVDEKHKPYILKCFGDKYRSYKSKLKAKYYEPYDTIEEKLQHKPLEVSENDWRWLVCFWSSEEAKEMSRKNKENRAKLVIRHTSSSKSYALIRYEQAQIREDKTEPNRIDMFFLTHTRKDGMPIDEPSKDIMAQFQQLSSQSNEESLSSTSIDEIYTKVMGPERHGRVRGYGFGVTPTSLFGSTHKQSQKMSALEEQLIST